MDTTNMGTFDLMENTKNLMNTEKFNIEKTLEKYEVSSILTVSLNKTLNDINQFLFEELI